MKTSKATADPDTKVARKALTWITFPTLIVLMIMSAAVIFVLTDEPGEENSASRALVRDTLQSKPSEELSTMANPDCDGTPILVYGHVTSPVMAQHMAADYEGAKWTASTVCPSLKKMAFFPDEYIIYRVVPGTHEDFCTALHEPTSNPDVIPVPEILGHSDDVVAPCPKSVDPKSVMDLSAE